MLTGMRFNHSAQVIPQPDDRYSRNVKEDLKYAIDLLINFKESLDKLHPECSMLIEQLLQRSRDRY